MSVSNFRRPGPKGPGRDGQKSGAPKGKGLPKADALGPEGASVSKIKAGIRSCNRLLSKEDVPQTLIASTERKLAHLTDQLSQIEGLKKEKKFKDRYKGIRFFERVKLVRKIKSALKKGEGKGKEKEKDVVGEEGVTVEDWRRDLNYVLHYPFDKKYISLFPSGQYIPHSTSPPKPQPPAPASSARPSESESASTIQKTGVERWRLRRDIKEKMDRGEIGTEPEKDLDEREAGEGEGGVKSAGRVKRKRGLDEEEMEDGDETDGSHGLDYDETSDAAVDDDRIGHAGKRKGGTLLPTKGSDIPEKPLLKPKDPSVKHPSLKPKASTSSSKPKPTVSDQRSSVSAPRTRADQGVDFLQNDDFFDFASDDEEEEGPERSGIPPASSHTKARLLSDLPKAASGETKKRRRVVDDEEGSGPRESAGNEATGDAGGKKKKRRRGKKGKGTKEDE